MLKIAEIEADEVLKIKGFTFVNNCFQHKSNEDVGVFWHTLYTDILGNYTIADIKPGIYTFIITYISYEEVEINKLTINDKKELNIKLKPL